MAPFDLFAEIVCPAVVPDLDNTGGPTGTGVELESVRSYDCDTGYVYDDDAGSKHLSITVECVVSEDDATVGEWSNSEKSCQSKLPKKQIDYQFYPMI